jgi:hypothetical protein
MQVGVGSQDRESSPPRSELGIAATKDLLDALPQQRSNDDDISKRPLPVCSAASAFAAYSSSLLRTYVDVKLREPSKAEAGKDGEMIPA